MLFVHERNLAHFYFFMTFFFAPTHHTLREPALGGGFFLRERERERMTRGYYLCSRKEKIVQIITMNHIMTTSIGSL